MVSKVKYSVIVPVYNNLQYTKSFLESFEKTVNHIERKNLELIFINNNSTDGTTEFLSEQTSKSRDYLFIHVSNEKNVGVSPSWNQGLREAKGDVLIVCNNDIEFLTPNWISALAKNVNDMVCWASPRTVYEKDCNSSFKPSHYEQLAYGVNRLNYVVGCCFAMPRSALESVGYFDEQFEMAYYEDLDYINRIKEAGKKLKMVQEVVVYHAVGKTSRTIPGTHKNEILYNKKWGKSPHNILNNPLNARKKSAKHFE